MYMVDTEKKVEETGLNHALLVAKANLPSNLEQQHLQHARLVHVDISPLIMMPTIVVKHVNQDDTTPQSRSITKILMRHAKHAPLEL